MSDPPLILVVDDEIDTLDVISMMLDTLGYRTITAMDGRAALEIILSNPPDLIISDVLMPEMDGFELCRRVKENRLTRLIPVVLLTGLGSSEDRIQGIEAGADDFISKPFQHAELRARVSSLLRLKQFTDDLEHAEQVIISLALAVEAKDPYTKGHCQRLSRHGVEVGKQLGLEEEQLRAIHRGAILHDIGKIAIPESILLKTGSLTAKEREIMCSHAARGEEICRPLRSLASALPIIRHHHEWVNGQGYPDGLVGETIPIGARIVAAVDYYDALVTDRPYRKAMPKDEALPALWEAVHAGHLDPKIVRELDKLLTNDSYVWLD
ncbi:MAG TPA: response regulator [Bacteroidetes bacterium]|nr:response regulator [Bacteroidota bacterium]